uniref:Uncharacterized protein n=1 Tax=Arundo donax TaxID=35708 RepID=A0A0A9CWW1_ARUDO
MLTLIKRYIFMHASQLCFFYFGKILYCACMYVYICISFTILHMQGKVQIEYMWIIYLLVQNNRIHNVTIQYM